MNLENMTAKELRAARLLWPENLSDQELAQELDSIDPDVFPIATRMLRDEERKRRKNK